MKKKHHSKREKPVSPTSIRVSITLPTYLWERIKAVATGTTPKLSANQVVVLTLDYATRDLPKIEWIFKELPKVEDSDEE